MHILYQLCIVASSDTENVPIGIKRKLLSEYSTSHARRLKKEAFGACSSSLGWLKELGLLPLSLEIWNTATKKREQFCVERDTEIDDEDLISIALLIKDRRMISGMYTFVRTSLIESYVHQVSLKYYL